MGRILHIAYFVHDLSDPAVARRVRMFEAGGARVSLIGFRRSERPPAFANLVKLIDLGRTEDAQLKKRALSVLKTWLSIGPVARAIKGADVVVARNLEVMLLAARAAGPGAPLVYESLDIHRSLLSQGAAGRLLRAIERSLLRKTKLLITSSPAFVERYFEPVQGYRGPILLVENKPLALDGGPPPDRRGPEPGPPWRIGWFGMLRCAKSLGILRGLAAALPGRVEVVIAGRPALTEFGDFHAEVPSPGVRFLGAYGPDDLERLYGQVHFTWAIDYFEEGQNSAWLLPNRLYEGGLHGTPAIALRAVQTGRWLADHGAGLLLDDPEADLPRLFGELTPARYAELRAAALAVPIEDLRTSSEDCRRLVARLGELGGAA